MKILILMGFMAPLFASAQIKEHKACWFSNKPKEHQTVATKGCSGKACHHIVACGAKPGAGDAAYQVAFMPKSGSCENYDAMEVRSGSTLVEAEYNIWPHNGTLGCEACLKKCPHDTKEARPCDTGCTSVCGPKEAKN